MATKPSAPKTTLGVDLTSLIGQPVTEFLARFCRSRAEVTRLRFVTYTPEPKLSERLGTLLTQREEELRDQAVAICHDSGIPFWDALFGICMKRDKVPDQFLEAAAAHSPIPPTSVFDLVPEEVSARKIDDIISQLSDRHGLVVSSKILLKTGEFAHLPMLDFRCPCSKGNALAIEKILALLGQKSGLLVESGRSYHFYGIELLSTSEWTSFMAHALLFAPIVDPRYIAHRIADGECRLKIAGSKDAGVPIIANVFTNLN